MTAQLGYILLCYTLHCQENLTWCPCAWGLLWIQWINIITDMNGTITPTAKLKILLMDQMLFFLGLSRGRGSIFPFSRLQNHWQCACLYNIYHGFATKLKFSSSSLDHYHIFYLGFMVSSAFWITSPIPTLSMSSMVYAAIPSSSHISLRSSYSN